MKIHRFLLAMVLCVLCVTQASALEYSFDTPEDYPFGQPTSDGTVYEWKDPNVDRGKDSALIPPGFGTPTSYLPGSGEFLTPNLAAGGPLHGGGVLAGGGVVAAPGVGSYPTTSTPVTAFTDVTKDLYYSNGSLGTLKIPAIDLTVKIYEGTDNTTLAKGAGHFTNTSIWDGNVAFAAHNRGVNNYFGKIHTLEAGDIITLTTRLGNRTYVVASVEKVSVMDTSGTDAAADNRVTLYTCVMNQPEYRWCVTAMQKG